jgi:hypothetical protein
MATLSCTATYRLDVDGTRHEVTVEQELALEPGSWTMTVTTPAPHDVRAEFAGGPGIPLEATVPDLHALLVEAAIAASLTLAERVQDVA